VSRARVAVFLDRDGTLNEEVDFVRTPDDLHLIAGAVEAVRKLNDRGLIICVISNQSGVARGYMEEEDLVLIHEKLERALARSGASIGRIYYCPHHPTEGVPPYNIVCGCRKPKIGMLERGVADSFVVGDSVVDMQAGNAAHAKTVLVLTGYGTTAREQCASHNIHVDHVAPTIVEAIDFILHTLDGKTKS
jgi:D-glycero-D-manno-heptose 1,7-bisphosphate phosphatase